MSTVTIPDRFQRLLFRIATPLKAGDGNWRVTAAEERESTVIYEKLTTAFSLLAEHAPLRLAYLRRDLPRILVSGNSALATCHFAVGICSVQFDYVVDPSTSPEMLAVTLVHEGTHARLSRYGFPRSLEVRPRIERICIIAELVVARRLNQPRMVEEILSRLDWPDSTYSREAIRERNLRYLRELGIPGRIGYVVGLTATRLRRLFGAA